MRPKTATEAITALRADHGERTTATVSPTMRVERLRLFDSFGMNVS